jgi:hypothetical protein
MKIRGYFHKYPHIPLTILQNYYWSNKYYDMILILIPKISFNWRLKSWSLHRPSPFWAKDWLESPFFLSFFFYVFNIFSFLIVLLFYFIFNGA